MKCAVAVRLLLSLALAVLLGTCGPQPNNREFLGELGVSGPNVYVNRVVARNGTWIYSGDSVTTGPGSSAMVVFASGGYFQLDANTDPFFSWATVDGVRCVLVKILGGQAYVKGGPTCIDSPVSDAVEHSAVNMVITDRSAVFTLLEGSLTISRPGRATLVPGQEAQIGPRTPTPRVTTLRPGEAEGRIQWRYAYRFTGWCGMGDKAVQMPLDQCHNQFSFSPPRVSAPGGGIGITVGGGINGGGGPRGGTGSPPRGGGSPPVGGGTTRGPGGTGGSSNVIR